MRGNTAVEFGVVPEAISGDISSLHKLLADPRDSSARAVGLCSTITAGSNVSYRVHFPPHSLTRSSRHTIKIQSPAQSSRL